MAMYMDRSDEGPYERNGRVTPMTGMMARHIPMFMMVWAIIMPATPMHMYEAYFFLVCLDIQMILRTSTNTIMTYSMVPMKPNFSARTEKMKSDRRAFRDI